MRRKKQTPRQNLPPERKERIRILQPPERPPRGRPKGMELLVRGDAVSGDVIAVRVLRRSDHAPLERVPVVMSTPHGEEVARCFTDAAGTALLAAPMVEVPTVVEYGAERRGFTTYIYGNDPRAKAMLLTNGFTPLVTTTVLPTIYGAIVPTPQTVDFEIEQAFGWLQGVTGYKALVEKTTTKGWQADDDWWATKSGMQDHFAQKGPEDMWTFFGHTGVGPDGMVKALIAWQVFFVLRGGNPVSVKDLCDAAKMGNGPPGIVVLAGCQSADLLDELVACCVKLAIGFTKTIAHGLAASASREFWESLLDGKTLAQALAAANAILGRSILNSNGCTMTYRTKAHIANPEGMTLEEIRKAKRDP
ncbi:MAG: hypothetical protein ACT4P7_10040 [Gemmatimonadaceae bacterium]